MNPTTRRRVFQVLLALAIIALVVIQGLLEVNPNH
jgi:cytochrome c-type biogenesis protein CcmE